MIASFLKRLFGERQSPPEPPVAKKKPKRGKWVTTASGGWEWLRDPRDTAEPKEIQK